MAFTALAVVPGALDAASCATSLSFPGRTPLLAGGTWVLSLRGQQGTEWPCCSLPDAQLLAPSRCGNCLLEPEVSPESPASLPVARLGPQLPDSPGGPFLDLSREAWL